MTHTITPYIEVKIVDDAGLVSAFLKWQLDTDVYSIRGYGYSGRGGYGGFFEPKDQAAIESFFAAYARPDKD